MGTAQLFDQRAKLKTEFVFSPFKDAWLFMLPMALVFIFYSIFSAQLDSLAASSLAYFLVVRFFINICHVTSTYFAVSTDPMLKAGLAEKIWVIPLAVTVVVCLVYSIDALLFQSVLAYCTVAHVLLQQFGWFKRSIRSVKPSLERALYFCSFFGVTLLPILYWHSGASKVTRSFYYPNSILLLFPQAFGVYFASLHWVFVGLFLAVFVSAIFFQKVVRWGLLTVFSTTWCIYYLGLIGLDSKTFFWLAATVAHGWGYIGHVLTYTRESEYRWTRSGARFYASFSRQVLLATASTLALGTIWYFGNRALRPIQIFTPVVWLPLFIHMAFDSIIWKNAFRKRAYERAESGHRRLWLVRSLSNPDQLLNADLLKRGEQRQRASVRDG